MSQYSIETPFGYFACIGHKITKFFVTAKLYTEKFY